MNYLGIDYGTKRMGLSTGDDELKFAVPIETIHVRSLENAAQQLSEIVAQRHIHKIVMGYPIHMDGHVGVRAKEVDRFIVLLQRFIAVPIERMDERLTSENVGDLRHHSFKSRQNLKRMGAIDSASAVLILQDHFDSLAENVSVS
jgi:putative Holliday junction resolvase